MFRNIIFSVFKWRSNSFGEISKFQSNYTIERNYCDKLSKSDRFPKDKRKETVENKTESCKAYTRIHMKKVRHEKAGGQADKTVCSAKADARPHIRTCEPYLKKERSEKAESKTSVCGAKEEAQNKIEACKEYIIMKKVRCEEAGSQAQSEKSVCSTKDVATRRPHMALCKSYLKTGRDEDAQSENKAQAKIEACREYMKKARREEAGGQSQSEKNPRGATDNIRTRMVSCGADRKREKSEEAQCQEQSEKHTCETKKDISAQVCESYMKKATAQSSRETGKNASPCAKIDKEKMDKICKAYMTKVKSGSGKGDGKKGSPDSAPPKLSIDPHRIFKVYRFNGILGKGTPKVQTYELDVRKCGKMILDALIKLKEMDPTLTFRRSCREGICGSCSMNVQGSNCLACIKAIPPAKTITIYPLPHMYVIRDLVVDMTHFLKGYDSIRPYICRNDMNKIGKFQFAQDSKDMNKVVGLYECVLCACCSTACPSYWWNGRRFLGPAALMHAYRWVIDSRDEDTRRRLHDLRDDFKAFRCHTIMNCTIDCPKGLNPAKAIALLKRLIAGLDKKPLPNMEPLKFAESAISKSNKC